MSFTLLVIDDNAVDRMAVRRLVPSDWTVLEASCGADGARVAGENSVACILLDQRLPDIDGVSLLPQLGTTPVILLTGQGSTDVAVEALKAGASDYLTKDELNAATVRRAVEGAVARCGLQRRLAMAERLESVGRLAGGVAHDFNNMLTAIMGHARLVLDELGPDHESAPRLNTLLLAAERSADLTQRLLAFARRLDLAPEVVSLPGIVEETRMLIRSALGEGIELSVDADSDQKATARVDAGQLQQALINLVLNARDAMPHGGRLHIKTERVEPSQPKPSEPSSTSEALATGAYAVVSVSDTGCGMRPEVKDRAFEPFFTTKPEGVGTGLGLASVRGFVEQSGGRVQVDSEVGEGTTVAIYLPCVDRKRPSEAAPGGPTRRHEGDGRILLIEDEELVRSLLTEVLSGAGYEVDAAANAVEAVALASADAVVYDLVLSDVVLPGASGPAIVRSIRAQQPAARVVFMSGYTAGDYQGELAEAAAFLPKPVSPSELLAKIRDVLAT